MQLTLAPLAFYWSKSAVFDFYRQAANSEFDVIYLGETVCSKRRELSLADWLEIAQQLSRAGKEVVLSSLTLLSADSEQQVLHKLSQQADYLIEANDYSAVELASRLQPPFIAGASLNIYSEEALAFYRKLGMRRWNTPYEATGEQIKPLAAQQETEVFAYGLIPLAWAARCFTARHLNIAKDDCRRICIEYPQGIELFSQEAEPMFTLNGIQTLSGEPLNYLSLLPEFVQHNISHVRFSAHNDEIFNVAKRVRQILNQDSNYIQTIQGDNVP